MVNNRLVALYLNSLDGLSAGNQNKTTEMAGKAPVNQQAASGPESDLVKDLVNDLVANLNKNVNKSDAMNGALSINGGTQSLNGGSPDSDQDEQDKDSINNEDDVTDNDEMLSGDLQAGELIKHHNGRNSISSSGNSSTEEEEEDVDELQPSVEHERIQEYLNRKDTAVVYPVDVCETANLQDLPLSKLNSSLLNASDQQPIKRKKNGKYRVSTHLH